MLKSSGEGEAAYLSTTSGTLNLLATPENLVNHCGARDEITAESTWLASKEKENDFLELSIHNDDVDVADIEAPACFFLATPSEVCSLKGVNPAPTLEGRLEQFNGFSKTIPAREKTDYLSSMERSPELPIVFSSGFAPDVDNSLHTLPPFDIDEENEMIDNEVAFASQPNRNCRSYESVKAPKFNLRPKPLSEEEFWNADVLFRT